MGGGEGELSKQVEARLVNYQCISLHDQLLAGCRRSVIRERRGPQDGGGEVVRG